MTVPHSQSEPVGIETSAPFLPPCHSLDSFISLWKHAALKILWVRQSIVLISTKIHLKMILQWCLTLWKPTPSWTERPAVSGWVQNLLKAIRPAVRFLDVGNMLALKTLAWHTSLFQLTHNGFPFSGIFLRLAQYNRPRNIKNLGWKTGKQHIQGLGFPVSNPFPKH